MIRASQFEEGGLKVSSTEGHKLSPSELDRYIMQQKDRMNASCAEVEKSSQVEEAVQNRI